jgi:hypothetical protein
MAPAALVNLDIEIGDKIVKALDEDGKALNVAMWAKLPEFENWRFVIASDRLNQDSPRIGYSEVDEVLRKVNIRFPGLPALFLAPMKRPFIQALRQSFASAKDTYGMRLGNQVFGDQFLEDAFVYRIR